MASHRWPLHPEPIEGEALSSWLGRVGGVYSLSARELLQQEFGVERALDDAIDSSLADPVFEALSVASGFASQKLMEMTINSPMIRRSRELIRRNRQSVLLPKRVISGITSQPERAWRFVKLGRRACPSCLLMQGGSTVPIAWRFPLIVSCQVHGVMLETYRVSEWAKRLQLDQRRRPQVAHEAVLSVDRRFYDALAGVAVTTRGGTVAPAEWLAFAHQVMDELGSPALAMPARTREAIGLGYRDTPGHSFSEFETRGLPHQARRGEAVHFLLHAIETGRLAAPGDHELIGMLMPLQPTATTPSLFLTHMEMLRAAQWEAFSVGSWSWDEGIDLHDVLDYIHRGSIDELFDRHLLLERSEVPWRGRRKFVATSDFMFWPSETTSRIAEDPRIAYIE